MPIRRKLACMETRRRYLKDGQITLTPEPFGEAQAYTARAEFLPLVMLTDKAETPSRGDPGGSCLRRVCAGAQLHVDNCLHGADRGEGCLRVAPTRSLWRPFAPSLRAG